ncbi:MAG: outer membrane beta-barrel protein [Gammaproteobacteria bacterium]
MKSSIVISAVVAAIWAAAGNAAEFSYGAEVGVGTSDNIRRVPSGEESETILTTGIELAVLREEGRLHSNVDLDLSYYDYQDEAYDGEVTGIANADLRYLFVPGRFEWVLIDSFGQSEIDPFAASTPDNRENINYFTTGPDFTARLGSVGSLTLFGRYSATQFEDSNFDDERLLGGFSLGRDLSARSNVSLNATTERVEFDDETAGSNYDRQSAFLRYEIEGARTTIGAEAGYSEIHDNGTSNGSPIFVLDITRDLSARSALTLRGSLRSSDAASAMRAGNEIGGGSPGGPDQVSTTEPFDMTQVSLGWQFTTLRTTFTMSAGYEEDDYEISDQLNRERQNFQVSASRQITPRLTLRAQASLFSSDYDTAGQDDDETQFGLHLSWNATGRLFVEVDVENFSRDSSNALSEYDETRAFLRLAWRNSGGASGAR